MKTWYQTFEIILTIQNGLNIHVPRKFSIFSNLKYTTPPPKPQARLGIEVAPKHLKDIEARPQQSNGWCDEERICCWKGSERWVGELEVKYPKEFTSSNHQFSGANC